MYLDSCVHGVALRIVTHYLETFNANTSNGVGEASSNINVNFPPLQPGPDTTPNARPGSAPDVGPNAASDTRPDFTPDPRLDFMPDPRLDFTPDPRSDPTLNTRPDPMLNMWPDSTLDVRPDSALDVGLGSALDVGLGVTFGVGLGSTLDVRPDATPNIVPNASSDTRSSPAPLVKKKRRQADLTLLKKISKTRKKGDNFHQFYSHLLTRIPANKTYPFLEDSKKRIKIYSKITSDITTLVC